MGTRVAKESYPWNTGSESSTMNTQKPFQAVLWDLGGVIVRTQDWSRRMRWEARLGLKPFGLSELVFNGEMGRKASLGEATVEEIWTWVANKLGLPDEAHNELEQDFWAGDRVDQELVDFIRNLRPAYKTGLISNAWSDLRDAMQDRWGIVDAFDDIVISAEVGLVKPDPAIYQLALQRLRIEAREAIFIDDFPENIAGARAVGMQAILFKDPEQVVTDLGSLLAGAIP